MTTEEQAKAIVGKWQKKLVGIICIDGDNYVYDGYMLSESAIHCAITEVEAIIEYAKQYTEHIYDSEFFVNDVKDYQKILEHLKQM